LLCSACRAGGTVADAGKDRQTAWHQPVENIYRFPNGIDVLRYAKKPQRGAFPGFVKRDGEIVVGTIAGLRAVKNLPRLVRAVAAAGPHYRLAIAGEGPETMQR
jgi:glycosyltransferase involved in cell wall biosynthesis